MLGHAQVAFGLFLAGELRKAECAEREGIGLEGSLDVYVRLIRVLHEGV